MRLKNVSKFFDKDVITDGYTGASLFKVQFASYEGAQPDGTFSRKRTLSYAPGLVIPDRRVVATSTERWIVGDPNTDEFQGSQMRQTSKCKRATDYLTLLYPGQAALRDVTGHSSFYGYSQYLKDTVNTISNSDYNPQLNVSMAITEKPLDGVFLRTDDMLLYVRTLYRESEGFWTATCDVISLYTGAQWQSGASRLYKAEVSADFLFSGAYDPVTDQTAASNVITTGILMERNKLYDNQTAADRLNKAGDMTLLVAKSAVTPLVGQTVTTPDSWRITTITDYQDAWALHIQKV